MRPDGVPGLLRASPPKLRAALRDASRAVRAWSRRGLSVAARKDTLLASAGYLGLLALCVFWAFAIALAELNALFLAVSLIFSVFILHDYRFGVVLLIILMPLSASTLFPHEMVGVTGLQPLNLLMLATLVSCGLQNYKGGFASFVPGRLLWMYVVPIVVAGVLGSRHVGDIAPFFFSEDMVKFDSATGYLRDLLIKPMFYVLLALLIAAAVRDSIKPQLLIVPTMVSIWVMGVLLLFFFAITGADIYTLSDSSKRSFLSPLGVHANELGRLYAGAYALLLFTWARARSRALQLSLLATMGLAVLTLVLTFSRGGFTGFAVVNLLFLASRRNLTALVLGLLAIAVALPLMPGAFYERITLGVGQDADTFTAGRYKEIWLPLLPELLRSPIWGSGLSSIMWSDAMRAGLVLPVTHPHNAFLGAYLDMGIVGLALLLAYFWNLLREFRETCRNPEVSPELRGLLEGGAAGLVAFLVAGAAGSSLTPLLEQVYLWVAIGFLYGIRSRLARTVLGTGPRALAPGAA
jgi:O-antigen ligase